MLKDSLYTIKKISEENNFVKAVIELNAGHEIFKGHFPGNPVLPGVCMLQITQEIIEMHFNKKMQLIKADDIRFLQFIQPGGEQLIFSIQYDFTQNTLLKLVVNIAIKKVVCCKIKALFKITIKNNR